MKVILATAGLTLLSSIATAEETITFPARASNIPAGSYWTLTETSEGCCIMDLNVQRFNGNSWEGSDGGSANDENLDWNVPLYAPANGEVAACWRNFPDNPSTGEKLPQVQNSENAGNGVTKTIFGGGNHVVIATDDGNVMSLNHFKSGSIPSSLCPSNPGSTVVPPTMSSNGTYRTAAYIEPEDRPRVTEGQFIGRVGNSGNSSGAHLHMDIRPVLSVDADGLETLGTAMPLRVRNAWAQAFNNGNDVSSDSWFRMRGTILGEGHSPVFKVLLASPYLRRATDTAGAITSEIDTLFVTSQRAVTASISSETGHLKLIVWDIQENGITRRGDFELGAAKEVRLSEPASDTILVAVRQADDRLKMIAFRVTATGQLTRHGSATAGEIRQLDMATTSAVDRKAVTAVRTSAGDLKVIAWDVSFTSSGEAEVERLGEASAGAVSSLAISRASVFDGVFVAARIGSGDLRVIPWRLSNGGETLTRGDHVDAGSVGVEIDVAPLASGVAASMRDSDGLLRVITWDATLDGDILAIRKGTRTAHQTGAHRLLRSPLAGSNLTSVMRGGDGNLYLIGWAADDDGDNLRRISSSKAGQVTGLSADTTFRSFSPLAPREFILTALRDADGNLRLVTWDANLETD